MRKFGLLAIVALLAFAPAFAIDEEKAFDDPVLQARYDKQFTPPQEQNFSIRNLLFYDIEKVEVPVDNLRRIAEVEHVLGLCAVFLGSEMQGQAPFASQGRHLSITCSVKVLDCHLRMR